MDYHDFEPIGEVEDDPLNPRKQWPGLPYTEPPHRPTSPFKPTNNVPTRKVTLWATIAVAFCLAIPGVTYMTLKKQSISQNPGSLEKQQLGIELNEERDNPPLQNEGDLIESSLPNAPITKRTKNNPVTRPSSNQLVREKIKHKAEPSESAGSIDQAGQKETDYTMDSQNSLAMDKPPATPQESARILPEKSESDSRTWNDNTDFYSVDASLINSDQNTVTLQKENGQLIVVPKRRLSKKDIKYVNDKTQQQK